MNLHWKWLAVNLVLLAAYLGFFHLCLGAESSQCVLYGFTFSAVTVVVCGFFRKVFKNKYEYIFYHFLALDILIEGFIPLHEGYSFYGCAAGFWAIFTVYHFTGTDKFKCLCGTKAYSPQAEAD